MMFMLVFVFIEKFFILVWLREKILQIFFVDKLWADENKKENKEKGFLLIFKLEK